MDETHDDPRLTAYALGEQTGQGYTPHTNNEPEIFAIRRVAAWVRSALANEPLQEITDMSQRIHTFMTHPNRSRGLTLWPLASAAAAVVIIVGGYLIIRSESLASNDPAAASANPVAASSKYQTGSIIIGGDSGEELVELDLELPDPQFIGTKADKKLLESIRIDTNRFGKKRKTVYAPKGITNIAIEKPVTSSDSFPIIGELDLITDGDKEALDGRFVELAPGRQWAQIDLEAEHDIWIVAVWHNHLDPRVYRDVIVQVSNDPDFKTTVTTIYNNDHDNSSKMGVGENFEYFESFEGELMPVEKAIRARYVRVWSKGSTKDDANHYSEVEVYGRAVK